MKVGSRKDWMAGRGEADGPSRTAITMPAALLQIEIDEQVNARESDRIVLYSVAGRVGRRC